MAAQPLDAVWETLRRANVPHLAVTFVNHGIRSVDDVVRRTPELLAAGVSQSDIEAFLAARGGLDNPDAPQGRADHPICRDFSTRASFTLALAAASPNNRKRALDALQADVLSRSSQPAQESRIRTYRALCAAWDVVAFPLTIESVRCTGASLKAGHYRSAQLYYQAAMGYQMRQLGLQVDPLVRGTIIEVVRSVKRGLGPARLKEAFDVWRLQPLTFSDGDDPFDLNDVAHCVDMVIIGVWWMLRELEMSSAQVHHLYLDSGLAHLLVPVHKSESAGNLLARALGCACKDTLARLCPWHCVERHLVRVYNHPCYKPQQHFPLFPDENGKTPSKQRMVAAFQSVIRAAGVELDRPDERGQLKPRFGGHVLRVSGAQFLASAGVATQHIQLLGRWSSMAVQRYIQLAPLSIVPTLPEKVLQGHTDELQAPGHLVDRAMLGAQQHDRAQPAGAPAGANQQAAVALPRQDFDAVLNRVNELECTVQSLQSAIVPPERPFIVRSRSRMVHLAQHDELSNPPTEWRSKCGWSYGVSNFYRITQVAPEHRRCKKCFSIPAEPGDDEQDSGSDSSGTSSSVESSEEVPS